LSRPCEHGPQSPQVWAPKIETSWPGLSPLTPGRPHRPAGCLGADDQRHLTLGKRHAAPAPNIDVVEGDHLDAHGYLADPGRRGRRQVDLDKFSVFHELQGAHGTTFLQKNGVATP
jgi:hypothetical protein